MPVLHASGQPVLSSNQSFWPGQALPALRGEVRLSIAFGAMALWLLPAILLALLLRPWLGGLAHGLAAAVATALSMRLKSHG